MSALLLGERVAPGFDDPIGLMLACHDRVREYARLLQRLVAYVGIRGVDDEAKEAARAVLRYFDVAAPLHHQDEEELFALLKGRVSGELALLIDDIEGEHSVFDGMWSALRPVLEAWIAGQPRDIDPMLADRFCDLTVSHAHSEEQEVFSRARDLLSEGELEQMGIRMKTRRMM